MIKGANVLGPEIVKAMGQAFDEAWAEIAGNFGDHPMEIETARLRLANAILSAAVDGSKEVSALKAGALHAMAIYYRSGIRSTDKKALDTLNGNSLSSHPS
jgi:hypothetical protein